MGERAKTYNRIQELNISKLQHDVRIAELKLLKYQLECSENTTEEQLLDVDQKIDNELESKNMDDVAIGECEGYLIELDIIDGILNGGLE